MGNMPEMETNHVKAEQVGLASGGRVRVFSSHRSPSFTLLFDVDQGTLEAETKRKSIEGKYNGATATDSLPRAGKQLSAQRLGS